MQYEPITRDSYSDKITNRAHEYFNNNETEVISNILGLNNISLGVGVLLNRDNPKNVYYIDKIADKWYLVHRYDDNGHYFYKCDEVEGLQQCLTETLA